MENIYLKVIKKMCKTTDILSDTMIFNIVLRLFFPFSDQGLNPEYYFCVLSALSIISSPKKKKKSAKLQFLKLYIS